MTRERNLEFLQHTDTEDEVDFEMIKHEERVLKLKKVEFKRKMLLAARAKAIEIDKWRMRRQKQKEEDEKKQQSIRRKEITAKRQQ